MKEATGDLNMTLVIVVIVASLVAFFSMLWRDVIAPGFRNETNCSDAICKKENCDDGTCECDYYAVDRDGNRATEPKKVYCPDRG